MTWEADVSPAMNRKARPRCNQVLQGSVCVCGNVIKKKKKTGIGRDAPHLQTGIHLVLLLCFFFPRAGIPSTRGAICSLMGFFGAVKIQKKSRFGLL